MEEDLDVIDQIRAGQIQAYAVLVRKYQSRIRGYCLGVLGQVEEAEDAAQEIFVKAYRGLEGFKAKASFSTWIYQIAVNHCRDLLKKSGRGKMDSWEALREQAGEAVEIRTSNPESAMTTERRLEVLKALNELPENYKTILVLRELDGFSYQELAETLDRSLDTIKARLRRARQALEVQLRKKV